MIIDRRFVPGDRIRWTYVHYIGRSSHLITKRGVFVRYSGPDTAVVHFDSNRTDSRVCSFKVSHD